ncbi:MAG: ATP-binding protein [Capsulimonas sp.]|uniref:ATP-binding protein n=1 Tax=Capsulimonas sp. TaxID=2494211 RepID=UPI0032639487
MIARQQTFWDWKTIVLTIVGALVTALGVCVQFGWHTHNLWILQIQPAFTPMVYTTALCFTCCGASLLSLTLGRVRRLVTPMAVFSLIAGLSMLIEHVFHMNLGVDQLLMPTGATVATATPGRMACATSICFALVATCLLLLRYQGVRRWAVLTVGALSAAVIGIGLVAFCGYLTGVTSFYAWGSLARMAVHTSIGFVFLGSGLCLYSWREEARRGVSPAWLPFFVGLGIVTASFCLYQALIVEQRQQIERLSRLEAINVRNEITSQLQVRTDALQLLARRWSIEGNLPEQEWNNIAQLYTQQHQGYQAIEWIDRNYIIRRAYPPLENERVMNMDLKRQAGRQALLDEARDRTDFSISPVRQLKQGGKGFLIDIPLRCGGRFDGFATGVFRMNDILKTAISRDITQGYSVVIYDGDKEVYARNKDLRGAVPLDAQEARLQFHGAAWRVVAWPLSNTMSTTEDWAPLIALWTGLVMAVICSTAVGLGQAARRQARELTAMNSALTREVSQRELALQAMQSSENKLLSVTETANEAIVVADGAGLLVSWNKGAQSIFGYPSEDVVGRPLTLLMPERFHAMHAHGMERFLATGEAHVIGNTVELAGIHQNGSEFPLELSLSSWTSGGEIFFTGIIRDMTERKLAEEALRQARDEALASARAKSEFLANMSHEIRTPMNGVLGMTGLLLETSLSAEQSDYAATIQGSAESLLTIINDILDFSKIEAGKMAIDPTNMRFGDIVAEIVDLLSPRAAAAGLTLGYKVAPAARGFYWGDGLRIRQVITNFVGNALKFTEEGGVAIEVGEVSRDEDRSLLRIVVRDTGVGIPENRLEAVFESFTQVDGSTSRRYGGAGLGLTICRQLSELMGGRVGVESQLGTGSCFWLELPLERRAAGSVLPAAGASSEQITSVSLGLRVLVAEDNPINQKLALKLLEKWGYRADAVTDGRAAVDAWTRGSYDVLLMDVQMPEMDGLQATRVIRHLESLTEGRTPIIAMTANAMEGDRELCLDAGMDDYLSKPIKPAQLQGMLRGLEDAAGEVLAA